VSNAGILKYCISILSTALLAGGLLPGLGWAQDSAQGSAPDAAAPPEPVQASPTPPVKDQPAQNLPSQNPPSRNESGKTASPSEAFTIGASDVLLIHVMHEPELTGKYDVGPDGMISMTLAGPVKAAGMTGVQLADAIRDKLKDTIRNPEVSVQVTQVNSRKFIIQGEVRRPGAYALITPMTVLEALSLGQGFTDWANTKKIYVLRRGERLNFNYKDVSHGKHMDENIRVENGDQIFVP
jgi:polysaccharide export outer membrane protein